MKVAYRLVSGAASTAYLDTDTRDGDSCTGVDKYTDDPVTVRWTGDEWMEVT